MDSKPSVFFRFFAEYAHFRSPYSSLTLPLVGRLFAETGQMDRAVWLNFHQRVAIVLGARPFHHRHQRAVVDAADIVEIILMTVPLKDGQHFSRGFENFPYHGIVLHAVVVADIQPLMCEDDHLLVTGPQVRFEPFKLSGVDQITEFHQECELILLELDGCFLEF